MDPVLGQGPTPAMYNNPYGAAPQLPAGWVEYRTPTGQPYWYNTFTAQSSWVFPMMASVVPPPQPPKKKKQIKKKIPGTYWLFVLTHDGYEFYYDRETKKSIWEMPEELKEPMEELKKLEEEEKKLEEEEKKLEEEEKKKEEEEKKAAEESKKRALLEQEAEQEAKHVKLEEEIVQEENVEENAIKEQELDATEMTEEDIMWQLQQMEEDGEQEEYNEENIEQQLLLQQQQEEEEQQQQQQETIKKEEEQPKEKKEELSEEERISKFNELLEERNISPFAVYSAEMPKLMSDPRFSLVPHNKQKTLFNKYCNALGEKIKEEKNKKNSKKPEDKFKELLESKVTTKMYWDDFRRKFKDDPRFKALSVTREKEALFKNHIKHNLGKKKNNPVDDYIDLLKETKDIRKGIRWRDAKKILEKDDRYYAIDDKDKREDLFRDYLDELL